MPALPKRWENGKLTGVTVAGGAKLDMSWREGKLTDCYFSSVSDMELKVVYGNDEKLLQLNAGMKHHYSCVK